MSPRRNPFSGKAKVPRLSILVGDARERLRDLPDESVHCVVTSPPYWGLRDYGTEPQVWGGDPSCRHTWQSAPQPARRKQVPGSKQSRSAGSHRDRIKTGAHCKRCGAWRGSLGHEPTPQLYVDHLVEVFREVRRVLRKDGTLWLNMGDCYATSPPGNRPNTTKDVSGLPNSRENLEMRRAAQARRRDYGHLKPKDLVGMPWRVAFALQADGWWLRSDIVWHKPNPMPESVRDRPTKAHEYVFLLTRSKNYFFDQDAVREPQDSRGERHEGKSGYREGHPSKGGIKVRRLHPVGRNIRSVWKISPQAFPEAHFAVFPERLVEPCIKAGTSERGCCPECGVPWRRVLGPARPTKGRGSGNTRRRLRHERNGPDDHLGSSVPWSPAASRTIGWRPSCECDVGATVPCTVLDPFLGAGTTALVAFRLGRAAIGIELNPEYADMAQTRFPATASPVPA